jgi:hypothetical protein
MVSKLTNELEKLRLYSLLVRTTFCVLITSAKSVHVMHYKGTLMKKVVLTLLVVASVFIGFASSQSYQPTSCELSVNGGVTITDGDTIATELCGRKSGSGSGSW